MRSEYITDSNPIIINSITDNINDLTNKDDASFLIKDMYVIYELPNSSSNISTKQILKSESYKDSLFKLLLSHFKTNTNISISVFKLIELSNLYIEHKKQPLTKETCINHMKIQEIYREILILFSLLLVFLSISNTTHEKTVQSEQILNGIYLFSSIDNEDFNEDDYLTRNISHICKEIISIFSDSFYFLLKKTVKNIVLTKGNSEDTDDYLNIISYIFLIVSNCIIDDTFNIKIIFSIEKFMIWTEKLMVLYEFLVKSGKFLYNSLVFESFLENLTFFHLQIERNLSIFDENDYINDGFFFSLINIYSLFFKVLYVYSDLIRNYNKNSQSNHNRDGKFMHRNNEKINMNTGESMVHYMESTVNLLSKIKIITNFYMDLFNNKLFSIILFDYKEIYKTLLNILYSYLLINNNNQHTTDLLMIFKLINTIIFSYKPSNLVLFSKNPLSFFSSSHEIYKKEGNLVCDEIQIQFFISKDFDLLLVQISNCMLNHLRLLLVRNQEESVGLYDESCKEPMKLMGVEFYFEFNLIFSKYYVIYEKASHSLYLQSIIDLYNSLNTVNHIKNMVVLLEILENLVKNNKNPGLSTLFRCEFLMFPSKIKYLSVENCFFQKEFCLSWIRLCFVCLVESKKTENFYGFSDFFVGSDFFLIVKELSHCENDGFHEICLFANRILSLLENEFGFCVDD